MLFTEKNFSKQFLENVQKSRDESRTLITVSYAKDIENSTFIDAFYWGDGKRRFIDHLECQTDSDRFDAVFSKNPEKFQTAILFLVPTNMRDNFIALLTRMNNTVERGLNSNYGNYEFSNEELAVWKASILNGSNFGYWKQSENEVEPLLLNDFVSNHFIDISEPEKNIVTIENSISVTTSEIIDQIPQTPKKKVRKRLDKKAIIMLDPKTNAPIIDNNGIRKIFDSPMAAVKYFNLKSVSPTFMKCLGTKKEYHGYFFDELDHYDSLDHVFQLSPKDGSIQNVFDSKNEVIEYISRYRDGNESTIRKRINENIKAHKSDFDSKKTNYDSYWFDKKTYFDYLDKKSRNEKAIIVIDPSPKQNSRSALIEFPSRHSRIRNA